MFDSTTLTAEDIAYHLRWKPSSGRHPGGYRVTRQDYRPGADPRLQDLKKSNGQLLLFRTYEGAKRRADKLNESAQ